MIPLQKYHFLRSGGVVFDAATLAWVAAVIANGGTVSGARKIIVNTLIVGLKADGIWTKLDRLWLFAAENAASALTDLIANSLATAVSSPTFTADQGYAGNGSSSYVNTNFNPANDGSSYQLNSASLHYWFRTSRSGADNYNGAQDGTPNIARINHYSAANTFLCYINSVNTSGVFSNSASDGLFTANRSGSTLNDVEAYRNGSTLTFSAGNASDAIPSFKMYIGALNISDTPFQPHTDQFAVNAYGGSFSATEASNLYSRLNTYMTAIGAA